MIVLGLDQSPTRIGWAMGHETMTKPVTGLVPLPTAGDDHARFLIAASDWLTKMIEEHGVEDVCCESVFYGKNPLVYAKGAKLVGAIEVVCAKHNVTCVEAKADDWRRHFIGFCKAPQSIKAPPGKAQKSRTVTMRRQHIKDAVMRSCAERNWFFTGDDEAEACGILDYRLSHLFPDYAAKGGPLFR